MPPLEKPDFIKRREGFLAEYKTLIEKYHVDFMTTPIPVPIGNGVFGFAMNTDLVDTTDSPTPSPIQFKM